MLPDAAIVVKRPEGYAFYALYPESYWEASRRLARARWQVIGVRSIGTSLGCMVAAGLDAEPPLTVRPTGPPFERRVIADAACVDRDAQAFTIVDEGPGQSGSSLAAVGRWLLDLGIAEQRVHVFASHRREPGPHASAAVRALVGARPAATAGCTRAASTSSSARPRRPRIGSRPGSPT